MTPPAPVLTVAMPARNAARFIQRAAASVLLERDLAIELIVVDDASEDETAAVVAAIADGRVRLLRNATRRGIGHCHNRVLAESSAPFVAHVDADDFIAPGALPTMVATLLAAPTAGQAWALHLVVDRHGSTSVESFLRQRAEGLRRGRDPSYRRGLIVHGMVVNPMRVYRREALDAVGPFNERLPFAVDYEMALRIAERYEIVSAPEFLYFQRIHDTNVTAQLRFKHLRFWWSRTRICRRLLADGRDSLLGYSPAKVYALLGLGLLHTLGLVKGAHAVVRKVRGA